MKVKEQTIHKYGFRRLIDIMGSDNEIDGAGRVSYGEGTRSVSDNRNLIRYLVRHIGSSPLEMGTVKFHLKLPIFVMRQLVRHRTASLNEYSGRYSIMSDDCYVPELDYIQPQSKTNNQGRGEEISDGWKNKYPNSSYVFILFFNSDPERQEEIITAIESEIANLQETGFGKSYLDKVNKQMLQEYKEKYKTTDFWLDVFQFYDWVGEPYTNIYRVEQLHQSRTLKEITNAARKYLVKKNYMVLTHLPE